MSDVTWLADSPNANVVAGELRAQQCYWGHRLSPLLGQRTLQIVFFFKPTF
jgi:hypothetical protein